MDVITQKVLMNTYVANESFQAVYPLFLRLRDLGLEPKAFILDGHRKVIAAIRSVWPYVAIQRCLYHILRQGLNWLRTYPKTQAGKDLRFLIMTILKIDSIEKRDQFLLQYKQWSAKYKKFVKSLPSTNAVFKDLKRTMALIANASPDMFHYLQDSNISSTTNKLESFYSRLKADFRKHRGLSEKHKRAYLIWYCYFKSERKTNTF